MANTDYLTNLHNRNAFEIDFENLSTHKHNTGIIITDLNDLKKINDTYGHRTGDEYIKKVAKILLKLPVLTFTGIYLDKSQGECSFCYNDLSDMSVV